MSKKIRFAQAPRKDFPSPALLKKCLQKTLEAMGFRLESLQYTFLSDDELLEMNKEFLAHDYYTDILTFDLSEAKGIIEGDVYISRDRVRENAVAAGVGAEEEFCRVIGHGLLHLCGLKDKTKADAEKMRLAEDAFIRLCNEIMKETPSPAG